MNQPSSPQRRAVIDVGTNSVKLLVADVAGTPITPVCGRKQSDAPGRRFLCHPPTATAPPSPKPPPPWPSYSATGRQIGRLLGPHHRHQRRARRPATPPNWPTPSARNRDWTWKFSPASRKPNGSFAAWPAIRDWPVCPSSFSTWAGAAPDSLSAKTAVPQFRRSYPLGHRAVAGAIAAWRSARSGRPGAMPRGFAGFSGHSMSPRLSQPALRACGGPVQLVGTSGTATILARMEAKAGILTASKSKPPSCRSAGCGAMLEDAMATAPGQPPENPRPAARPRRRDPAPAWRFTKPSWTDLALRACGSAPAACAIGPCCNREARVFGLERACGAITAVRDEDDAKRLQIGRQHRLRKKGRTPLQRPPSQQPN